VHLDGDVTRLRYELITTDAALASLCSRHDKARVVAIDTEFVSEHSYRPQLCLVQIATGGCIYLIDPLRISTTAKLFEWLAAPGRQTVVHAGREELRFSWRAIGRFPHSVFDVQIAAGLVGLDYPASYTNLVFQLLKVSLAKGETRSDWRKRPLSPRQLEYAAQDVAYLEPLAAELSRRLEHMGRQAWLAEEMQRWLDELRNAEASETWWRLPGSANLSTRSLAIVRELWRWREAEAQRQDVPPRRLLRDDLVIELARRQSADLKHIRSLRGLEREQLARFLPAISQAIQAALDLPEEQLPRRSPRRNRPTLTVAGQLLSAALGSICRERQVAPALVGSTEDVRDLIAYRLNTEGAPHAPPLLTRGWRAEVVGQLMDQLLAGEFAIRIRNATADQPLHFVRYPFQEQPEAPDAPTASDMD